MNIEINGNSVSIASSELSQILSEHVDNSAPFAVAINETFIPKSQYEGTTVNENDKIEILSPMQGG